MNFNSFSSVRKLFYTFYFNGLNFSYLGLLKMHENVLLRFFIDRVLDLDKTLPSIL
jgi:hypothetical protein